MEWRSKKLCVGVLDSPEYWQTTGLEIKEKDSLQNRAKQAANAQNRERMVKVELRESRWQLLYI